MIKNHLTRKTIAVFFILNFLSTILPYNALYANNNGPNAPEASGFEPVSATDMVNLSSGDMAYVLPLLEIDGFPVTLSYHAGIPMDMDASWIGLGWNINTGSIARGLVSTPDDWNGGRSMRFTYFYYETESYTVNVGVGFGKAAEVGVGLSWGSNKSLSGSVSASVGPVSASIDTDGNYSVGINSSIVTKGLGFKDAFGKGGGESGFGGSLSVSGNTKRGGLSVGASAGFSSSNGLNAGLGISISGNGIGASYSIGKSKGEGTGKRGAGAGGSIGSFSVGDMNISSSGFYLPITIGIFNFGFGYQRQKISYKKGLNRYGFGSLYQAERRGGVYSNFLSERNDNTSDNVFDDLQRRNYYGDTYDQELPQSEIDFIQDYKTAIDKINFTFAGYDNYNINASGISGDLSPLLGENTVLIGEGFEGDNTNLGKEKMKVFYHNSTFASTSNSLRTTKKLGNTSSTTSPLYFTFSGQVNNNVNITGRLGNFSGTKNTNLSLSDFARKSNPYNGRPHTGSFVEVFTNEQLDSNKNLMVLPKPVYNNGDIQRRVRDLGYMKDGIGGYKITAPDGKIYHFSQPVYQYEKVEHNYIDIDEGLNESGLNSNSKRTGTPYATHWLLTAITGPDYVDTNGNNYLDENDYGYWLRLDHGQWSNAYAWRTPYADSNSSNTTNSILVSKDYRRYSTHNENNVDKVDAGQFMQGRKDLYYLDKIVSRQQVAYFVKNIRKDGIGTDLDYNFTAGVNNEILDAVETSYRKKFRNNNFLLQDALKKIQELRNKQSFDDVKSTLNSERILAEEYAKYEKEYLLRLDKIIIEKNRGNNEQISSNTGGNNLNGIIPKIERSQYTTSLNLKVGGGTLFSENLPAASQIHRLHQSENVIDVNDFENYDYSKALKVIKFDNDHYELAKNSPNSVSSKKGRLTLKGVKTYGRGIKEGAKENELYDYMPPYRFSYKRPNLEFAKNDSPKEINERKDLSKKDSWGFIEGKDTSNNTLADSWSLNSIQTPQGGVIDIEYEEDDYYVEAFSRRFWSDNLTFNIIDSDSNYFKVEISNDTGITDSNKRTNFSDYFNEGDKVFFDLWIARAWDNSTIGGGNTHMRFDLLGEDDCIVDNIINGSNGKLIVKVKKRFGMIYQNKSDRTILNTDYSKSARVVRSSVDRGEYLTTQKRPRGYTYGNPSPGTDQFNMSYKLLATKSPKGNNGGGLKVAKITVNDDTGAKYETTYDYHVPNTDKSSGITSFYPTYGTSFVPYQNELPGPGVMYEWVTMKAKGYDASGRELPSESTRYHYYTLKPNFHIFNPNFEMKDCDGEVLFKATIKDVNIPKAKITAKDIHIEKNLGKVGQLVSIEKFNTEGHLINKTTNSYVTKPNIYKETYTSMKSIYEYDFDEDKGTYSNRSVKDRLLSLSSVSEKSKILNKVTTVTPSGVSSIEYENIDPWLGNYRTSKRTMADGTETKETKIPAYEAYSEMGSKISNPNNKNMLTQEAMNISSVKVKQGEFYRWKTTNASVTTWNNNKWVYRAESGNEPLANTEYPVWRKHKNYVWKGTLDDDGTYGKELRTNDFKWGYGATQTNIEWQEVSEITRYNHYSLPLETKDINNNYASSKMGDNWKKTIAGGNAKYTEMYYSGLEYANEGGLVEFEGELTFESCKFSNTAHTGDKAVALTSVSSKAFIINATVGNANTNEFRAGKYKASVWVKKHPELGFEPVKLVVNGNEFEPAEIVEAGDWALLNFYVNFTNGNLNTYFKKVRGSVTLDDFRMHPIASSMNSYVYDNNTDELRYILDGNNLATEFRYDKAGRLCRTYKEVVDQGTNIGGFKKVNEYRYRYQNAPSSSGECSCCETEVGGDPVVVVNDAPIAVNDTYSKTVTSSVNQFTLDVLSNDYDPNSFDVLSIDRILTTTSNGTVSIVGNKVRYIPNRGFVGNDSFTYRIKDNGNPIKKSNTATVNITVKRNFPTMSATLKIESYNLPEHTQPGEYCEKLTPVVVGGSGSYTYSWNFQQKIKDGSGTIRDINTTIYLSEPYDSCIDCDTNIISRNMSCTITDTVTGQRVTTETWKRDNTCFNAPR